MSVAADEELELLPGELDDAGGVSAEAGCEMRVFVFGGLMCHEYFLED